MKRLCLIMALWALAVSAQDTKRLILSPKTNISTAQIADGFRKYCGNVLITENASKADYVLEAVDTTSAVDGSTRESWHFTLLKDGDVLFTTEPKLRVPFKNAFAHHFQDTCKFLNGSAKKKKP